MDQAAATSPNGARRDQDIALDLFKFVASTAGIGRTASPSAGFAAPSAAKAEDHVENLLDLYTRCLQAVSGTSGK